MKRPSFDECKDVVDYVFRINYYTTQCEEAIRRLRLGITYAQDVIEADIPGFEQLLSDTRLGGTDEPAKIDAYEWVRKNHE